MRKVPKLRFKEFSDEWEEKKLGEIGNKITLKNNSEEIKIVLTNSAEKGIVKQEDFFDKEITNEKNINNYYIVSKNDFVYNPRISKQAPYGPINKSNIDIGIVSPLYLVFNIKNEDVNFLEKYFKSSYWHRYMYNIGNSGARSDRMNIGINDFFNMSINIPSLQEQEKIANFLSSIDKKIYLTEEKLELFREYKKGVMQKIFSQELRFKDNEGNDYPEWKEKRLGEIGSFKNGINKDKNDFGNGIPFINLLDIFNKNSISDNKKFGLVKATNKEINEFNLLQGDILFVRSSVKPEGVGLTTVILNDLLNTVYSGFIIRFRENKNILTLNYKKYCFYDEKFRKLLINRSTVSANTNINQDNLKLLSIKIPIPEEQEKIANFLSSIDEKIEKIENELENLKEFKKGLLQQMFV